MIALVIYVPHKKVYNYIKDRLAFAMEPAKCGKTQILGRGVHFYSFSDVELYGSTPIWFILFCFAFYPLIVFRWVLLRLGICFLNRLKDRSTEKIQRKGFHCPKDAFSLESNINIHFWCFHQKKRCVYACVCARARTDSACVWLSKKQVNLRCSKVRCSNYFSLPFILQLSHLPEDLNTYIFVPCF